MQAENTIIDPLAFRTKNKKWYLTAVAFLIVAVCCIYGYREFNRKPADLSKSDAVATITASDLYNLYSSNEDSANKKFLGRIIEVTGNVTKIENQQDTAITIFLGAEAETGGVSCSIDNRHLSRAGNATTGEKIKLKGICTGYLMDVELGRCVIVNN